MDNQNDYEQPEEEEEKESSIDRARDAIRTARTINQYRNFLSKLKSPGGLGTTGGTSAAGETAAAGAGATAASGATAAGGTAVAAGGTATWPVWLIILLVIIFLVIIYFLFFFGGNGGLSITELINQANQTGIQISPAPGPNANCTSTGSLDYTIDINNTSAVPQLTDDLKQQILSNWPKAQLQYWDTIISAAQQNKINPAFLLTLWIEESGASDKVAVADGGGGDPAGYKSDGTPYYATAHMGCAPWEDQTIEESLSCYFKLPYVHNNFFEDVMCNYGGDGFHNAPCTFNKENPEFPSGVKTWYSKLVPSGNGAIQSATACIAPSPANTEISTSTLSDVTVNLTNDVIAACGNSLTSNNVSCMQGINLTGVPYATSAISQLISSVTNNYCSDSNPDAGTCLQCVGFVQGAVSGDTGSPLDGGGNAKDYATNVPTGYEFIDKSSGNPVMPGDIIIKTGGSFGHIAIVTKVYDSNNIQVAEANYNYGGEIRLNNTVLSLWNGWLRKK